VKRSWPGGPQVYDGGIVIRGSHVILTEASVSPGGPLYVDHWYAGADGVFGTADDTFARILPSALPRYWPALGTGIAGGQLFFQSGQYRSNADVLGYDLSALRWDVAASVGLSPATNRAGTMLYSANSSVYARTSDGRETVGPGTGGWHFAADGSNLFVPSGNSVVLYRPDPNPASATYGQFFVAGAPAPTTIATLAATASVEAAGGGRAVAHNANDGTIWLLEPNPTIATPTVIALDSASYTYWPIPGNVSVAAGHLVFSCMNHLTGGTKNACFREPGGAGGAYGGSDRSGVLTHPSSGVAYSNAFAVAVSGDKVALVADGAGSVPHLFLLDAGPDKKFATGDDLETDFGPMADAIVGAVDFAGNYLVWTTNNGTANGQQVYLADVTARTQRVLTSHFSQKPLVVVDPTGRVYWQDMIFSSPAVFVSAP